MNLLRRIKKILIRYKFYLYNFFIPGEDIKESKEKWSRLADQDPRGYVVTNKKISTDDKNYRESGRETYTRYISEDELLQKKLKSLNAKTAIDIGCGTGRITEFFGNDFEKVYGTDIARNMIEEAKRTFPDSKFVFVETDGAHLPFPDKSIDFSFSFATFQHMPDEETVITNFSDIYKILRPGGLFKVQLRGAPILKKNWSYGIDFNEKTAAKLANIQGFKILYINRESDRNLWLLLEK